MTPAQRYIPLLIDHVARCYETTSADMFHFSKTAPASYEARRVVYVVAHKTLGLSTCQIGAVTGEMHAGVKHHLKRAQVLMRNSVTFSAIVKKVAAHTVRGFRTMSIVGAEAAE